MKTKTIVLLSAILILLSAACGTPATDEPEQQQAAHVDEASTLENSIAVAQEIGEGTKSFRFEVTDGEGNINVWNIQTNAATLGEALDEHGFLERDDTGMVSHVNGLRADFFEDGAYWALFIGDDWAMEGVDTLVIEEGATYAFVYTPA